MRIIYWNVYVGHNPQDVLKQVKQMAERQKPEVFGFGEASHQFNVLDDVPGYRRYQLKPTKSKTDEQGDTAVLVRNDMKIQATWAMRLKQPWKGPKHGWAHKPRIYRTIRIKDTHGQVWKISVGHWPFGTAKNETIARIKYFFKHTISGRPVIHVGDLNTREPQVRKIVKTMGAKTAGIGIDQIIYKNCKLNKVTNLGKHNSDHPAVKFDLSK